MTRAAVDQLLYLMGRGLRCPRLLKLRRSNWGHMCETRWLISVMIEHDLYHAGEINHIRALKQANDSWAWAANE